MSQGGLSGASPSAGGSTTQQVTKSPSPKRKPLEIAATVVQTEPQATRNVGQEVATKSLNENEKEEKKRGRKRKFDESIGSPLDVKRWTKDWDCPQNLHERGKEIGVVIEDLSKEDWEANVKKMEVWNQCAMAQSGVITYTRSGIKALTADICDRNKDVSFFKRYTDDCDSQKKVLSTNLEKVKKLHEDLKIEHSSLSQQLKEKEAAVTSL